MIEALLDMAGWLPVTYFLLAAGLGAASMIHVFVLSAKDGVGIHGLDGFLDATPLGLAAYSSIVGLPFAAIAAFIHNAGLLSETPVGSAVEALAMISVAAMILFLPALLVLAVSGLVDSPRRRARDREVVEASVAKREGPVGLACFRMRERIAALPDGARLIDPETGLRFWTRRAGPDGAPVLAVLAIDPARDFAMRTQVYNITAKPHVLAHDVLAPPTEAEYESALDRLNDAATATESELVALAEQLNRAELDSNSL